MAFGRKRDLEPTPAKEKRLSRKEQRDLEKKKKEEDAIRQKAEKEQAERDALMQLSEKELLVELILTARGYNERISSIERKIASVQASADIAALDSTLANMNTTLNRLK